MGFSSLREQIFLRMPDPKTSRFKKRLGLHQQIAARVSALFPNQVKYHGTTLRQPAERERKSHSTS